MKIIKPPKICSVFHEEVFGKTMCETWFNLVDAVMAGEDHFACPDQHSYDWVMGQFPEQCFPILKQLISYAMDRDYPHPDYAADDPSFQPIWLYSYESFDQETNILTCWRLNDGTLEWLNFDYSGF